MTSPIKPSYPRQALTVSEGGALSNLNDVTVRIADVAANLAVLGYRLRYELGASTLPQLVARLNIRDAEIHKAVDVIWVGDTERFRRLIRRRPAADVQNHPDIRKLKVPWRVAGARALPIRRPAFEQASHGMSARVLSSPCRALPQQFSALCWR